MKVKGMALNTFNSETLSLSLSMHWDNRNEWLLSITLGGEETVMNMLLIYLFASMKLEMEH